MTWSNKKQIWTQLGETFIQKYFARQERDYCDREGLGLVLIEGMNRAREKQMWETGVEGWHDQTLDQKIIC